MMLDRRAFINILMLVAYAGCFNYYLYQLFYGDWQAVQTKAFFYATTSIFITMLTVDDMIGYETYFNKAFNIISKFTIIITLTLIDKLELHRDYFKLFNGSIFVLSLMVIISGSRHGYFNKNND